MALNYTGSNTNGRGTYVSANGGTYTGSTNWLDPYQCNGIVVPGSWTGKTWPSGSPAGCASLEMLVTLTRGLGTINGLGDANHAIAAFTAGDPGAGVMAQTSSPVTLDTPLPSGRYISMSVNAAAVNCGRDLNNTQDDPLYRFEYSLNSGGSWVRLGTDVEVCTFPKIRPDLSDRMRGGTVFSNGGSALVDATNLMVRVSNQRGRGAGNDAAWDDLTIYDATPTLTKAFSPTAVDPGGVTTLTFAITNTSEKGVKAGWSFTDALPTGLTVAATPNARTTCTAATVTAAAGADTIEVTAGTIAAGVASCTVSVDIAVPDPAEPSYVNDLESNTNLIAVKSLIPDGDATLRTPATPEITNSFGADFIEVGEVTTLTFTITNISEMDRNWEFTNLLPSGLVLADDPNASTTCAAGSITAEPGDTTIDVSGGTVSAGTTCTVTVNVTSSVIGSYTNSLTGGNLTASTGLVPVDSATLNVGLPPPPKWTLNYDANGGSCTAPSQTEADGTWVDTYGSDACARDGFVFAGWNTSVDGSGLGFAPGAPTQLTGDNTLFAQWVPIRVVATDDGNGTFVDTAVSGSVAGNDDVPAGSVFAKASDPGNGTVTVNADGSYTYTPGLGFVGTDSFSYVVCAAGGAPCSMATVTITVAGSLASSIVTVTGESVSGSVAGSVSGSVPPGSVFSVVTQPANGTVVMNPDGTYRYVPNPGFVGSDSFTYQVCVPGAVACVQGAVSISVVNGPSANAMPMVKVVSPTTVSMTMFTPRRSARGGVIAISGLGVNVWGNRVVVRGKGTWIVVDGQVTFRPDPKFFGRTTIRYRVIGADGTTTYSTFTAVRIAVPGQIAGGR